MRYNAWVACENFGFVAQNWDPHLEHCITVDVAWQLMETIGVTNAIIITELFKTVFNRRSCWNSATIY